MAALTAALGLYARLGLPQPWTPVRDQKIPLLIYGGSSAVGSYALQFAAKSNIHPLIAVAGRASDHVEKLIDRSKGDTIVDYRKGDDAIKQAIKDALKGEKLEHVLDAVSEGSSFKNVAAVIDPHGAVTYVLPHKEHHEAANTVKNDQTMVSTVHGPDKDFGLVYSRIITQGLEDGWFTAQPQEVIPGGLTGVEQALKQLKDGTASAVKYVFKIDETPGAGRD